MLQSRANISNVLSKEAEMLLLGHLARTFGPKLVDSLDNPPSFTKSVFRMVELVQTYFRFHQDGVKRACAKTWADVYTFCFRNAPNNKKHFFLIQPLISMIKGGSLVVAQETSCQVLLDLIRFAAIEKDTNFIDLVIDDAFDLFLVAGPHQSLRSCQMTLLKIISFLTVHSSFDIISCYIYKCFEKIVVMLDEREADHHVKVEICKFLSIIGQKLIDHKKTFIGLSTDFVIKRITALTTDRVVKVQMSARESLRIWKKLERQYEEIEKLKMRVKFDVRDPDRLVELNMKGASDQLSDDAPALGSPQSRRARDEPAAGQPLGRKDRNADDSLEAKTYSSKQNSIARGVDVFKSNNLVEKTYLKQRAHNFQKKRTGTGGGFISSIDKQDPNKKKASFNEMREKFKQQIMQDKMSFTRKNLRGRYQNYLEDEDGIDAGPGMEKIQEDLADLKESELVVPANQDPPVKQTSNRPPPPATEPKPLPKPSDQQLPSHHELTFAREEVVGTEAAALPQKPQTNPYPRLPDPPAPKPPATDKDTRLFDSHPRDGTVATDSAGEEEFDGEAEGEEEQFEEAEEDQTVRADSSVMPKHSAVSMASTVYFGHQNPQDNHSMADTVHIQDHAGRHQAEDKATQMHDARTVVCDSAESQDEQQSDDSFEHYVPTAHPERKPALRRPAGQLEQSAAAPRERKPQRSLQTHPLQRRRPLPHPTDDPDRRLLPQAGSRSRPRAQETSRQDQTERLHQRPHRPLQRREELLRQEPAVRRRARENQAGQAGRTAAAPEDRREPQPALETQPRLRQHLADQLVPVFRQAGASAVRSAQVQAAGRRV